MQEEPQLVAREHSDPSLEWSRRNPPYSAATTPANSLQSPPASTPKHAGWQGQGPFGEGSVQQARPPDSAKPSRLQRDAPTGISPVLCCKSLVFVQKSVYPVDLYQITGFIDQACKKGASAMLVMIVCA